MHLIEETDARRGVTVHEDEPPAGTVAVVIDHDGCGGNRIYAVAKDEEVPPSTFPMWPEEDKDGYVGGRGWIGEAAGTEILTAEQVAARWPAFRDRLASTDRPTLKVAGVDL